MTAEATVLEPSPPEVPRRPAPWHLRGSGYILVVRLPEDLIDRAAFVPASLSGRRHGHTAHVLWMDYEQAECGPYQQLLIVPASFEFDRGHYPTATRIFVSSYDSAVNGRLNWGLPKDQADFARTRPSERVDQVQVSRAGHVFAELQLAHHGLSMPVHSGLLPAGLRTVVQHWEGKLYAVTLAAKGTLRMAKLLSWRFDPAYFPDLAQGRVLAAAYLPRFEMTFPEPRVRPWSP